MIKSKSFTTRAGSFAIDPFAVALVAIIVVYVVITTQNGFFASEDPVFHNGSYLIRNLLSRQSIDQRGLLTEGFRSLSIPYGLFAYFVELLGAGPVIHYKLQLALHLILTSFSLFLIMRKLSDSAIAFFLTIAALTTQAFYEQFVYSIGASQVIFVCFIIYSVVEVSVSDRKYICLALAAILLSLSLWSNMPQLISTWSVFIIANTLGYYWMPLYSSVIVRRSMQFCVVALVVYLPFIFGFFREFQIYENSLNEFRIAGGGFRNSGLFTVLQGFGKWSLQDKNWIVSHYELDMQPIRQLIRSVPFLVSGICVLYGCKKDLLKYRQQNISVFVFGTPLLTFIVFKSQISLSFMILAWLVMFLLINQINRLRVTEIVETSEQSRCQSRKFELGSLMFVCSVCFLVLAVLGNFAWYWNARNSFFLLSMFREPWAKFSIPYVIFLVVSFAQFINIYIEKQKHRLPRLLRLSTLFMIVFFLAIPAVTSKSISYVSANGLQIPFRPYSNSRWEAWQNELDSVVPLAQENFVCIYNFDNISAFQMLARTTFPVNSGVVNLRSDSLTNDTRCNYANKNLKLITLFSGLNSFSTKYIIEAKDKECILAQKESFIIIQKDCLLDNPTNYGGIKRYVINMVK